MGQDFTTALIACNPHSHASAQPRHKAKLKQCFMQPNARRKGESYCRFGTPLSMPIHSPLIDLYHILSHSFSLVLTLRSCSKLSNYSEGEEGRSAHHNRTPLLCIRREERNTSVDLHIHTHTHARLPTEFAKGDDRHSASFNSPLLFLHSRKRCHFVLGRVAFPSLFVDQQANQRRSYGVTAMESIA